MKYVSLFALPLLMACADGASMSTGGTPAAGNGVQEFLVIGSGMSFEACRAGGGLIIRDVGSPMTACDPSVRRGRVSVPDPNAQAPDMNAALEAQELESGAGG